MRPEDVPDELVKKVLETRLPSGGLPPLNEPQVRTILTALLPEIQAQALREAADYQGPADEAAHFTPEARNLLRSLADLIYEMGTSADDEKESRNAEEGNHRPDRMRAARLTESKERNHEV